MYSPEDSEINITFESSPANIKVLVRDLGPGIPPEFHVSIFEKFGQIRSSRQAQHNSTGLGLTFSKLAVVAHGGQIGVDSTPGAGSTFWFTLPKQKHTAAAVGLDPIARATPVH